MKGGVFDGDGGSIPGIGSADTRYASEHVVSGPSVDPWLEVVEACAGPKAVSGGSYEEGAVGEWIVALIRVLLEK